MLDLKAINPTNRMDKLLLLVDEVIKDGQDDSYRIIKAKLKEVFPGEWDNFVNKGAFDKDQYPKTRVYKNSIAFNSCNGELFLMDYEMKDNKDKMLAVTTCSLQHEIIHFDIVTDSTIGNIIALIRIPKKLESGATLAASIIDKDIAFGARSITSGTNIRIMAFDYFRVTNKTEDSEVGQ